MFAVFLIADLAAGWLSAPGLTGFGLAAGSAAAAGSVRRRDLLIVVITPPVIFVTAVICAELVSAHADHAALSAGSFAASVFLTISSAAPWMFGGLAGALTIATVRGLRRSVSDLLSGRPAAARPDAAAPAGLPPAGSLQARSPQARSPQAGTERYRADGGR
jgi:hypothetical protein